MAIADTLIPEFDREMAGTRTALSRVPDAMFAWKPHDKSMPLGRLATHLAEMPGWIPRIAQGDEMNLQPPGGGGYQPKVAESTAALLALFDENAAAARQALAAVPDADFAKTWRLMAGDREIMKMPKAAVYRTLVMNHMLHHRGQLTVYLRLNNVPVPGLYGPSADEPW